MMASSALEKPAVYISLMPGTPAEYARWVEIGAEEESVPCRVVEIEGSDLVERAYQTAVASPLKIGVAVSAQAVILHEFHMPPHQPVLAFELDNDPRCACRLMGANAARFFVRRPLYLSPLPDTTLPNTPSAEAAQSAPAAVAENSANLSPDELKQVIRLVVRIVQEMRERGVL